MKNNHFPILLEQDEDGIYIVSCPLFKGCHSSGASIDEALENIKEVIELCLEDEEAIESTNTFIGIRDLQLALSK
jgi:predicted RNase H-like HicB family nuclease